MKTYVIILSKHFPSGHRSAGQETHFAESLANGTKIHTIRDNFELWDKRVNDVFCGRAEISIRQWEGKPYRSKQVEIMRLTHEDNIEVERVKVYKSILSGRVGISAFHYDKYDWIPLDANTVAQKDGLSIDDWNSWFNDDKILSFAKEPHHPLAIIHFTKFRYL